VLQFEEHVDAAAIKLLCLPDSYPGGEAVVGVVRPTAGPQRFNARLAEAGRLPGKIAGFAGTIPRAWRLLDPTDVRPGISGAPVILASGVIGLIHFSRQETPDYTREAYVVPIDTWFAKNPELREHAQSVKPRAMYVTVPPLPENYVARTEILDELRLALMRDRASRNVAMIAIQGMGGLGKTLLAQAICHDNAVREAFPDGIVWLPIGKDSPRSVVTLMRDVAKTFGDNLPADISDISSARSWFRAILAQRAALIVLDDVWSAGDLDAFRAQASRSRILFTTRDASIAKTNASQVFAPGFLNYEQSRSLLATWSEIVSDHMPSTADDLIRECGGLPLAVATIGAMLRVRGEPPKPPAYWQHVCNLLRRADLAKLKRQLPRLSVSGSSARAPGQRRCARTEGARALHGASRSARRHAGSTPDATSSLECE
jgi:hypothetical protein